MRALLLTFSWQELRHHPWRSGAAVLAVMLGVALAFAVQLINASALSEFASAAHGVSGGQVHTALGALHHVLHSVLACILARGLPDLGLARMAPLPQQHHENEKQQQKFHGARPRMISMTKREPTQAKSNSPEPAYRKLVARLPRQPKPTRPVSKTVKVSQERTENTVL